ncbi:MAG: peptidyl-prolyl cis-trans isomerase, partial [Zetaproteobacteria bacterium]
AEIRNWYHAHEAEYRVPERRQVFWMLVSDKRLAQRIMRALQKRPERFRELARRYSQDAASCTTGGELGWLTADAEPRAITAKAFSVDQPGLIGPWQMPEGWAIVWVKAVEPAHTLPLEAVRDEIAAAIVETRIRARLEGIAKRAHVKQLVPDIAR